MKSLNNTYRLILKRLRQISHRIQSKQNQTSDKNGIQQASKGAQRVEVHNAGKATVLMMLLPEDPIT